MLFIEFTLLFCVLDYSWYYIYQFFLIKKLIKYLLFMISIIILTIEFPMTDSKLDSKTNITTYDIIADGDPRAFEFKKIEKMENDMIFNIYVDTILPEVVRIGSYNSDDHPQTILK